MRVTHNENRYLPGEFWHECDECGFDYLKKDLERRWDGAWVCPKCWEPRHPQDFGPKIPRQRPFVGLQGRKKS